MIIIKSDKDWIDNTIVKLIIELNNDNIDISVKYLKIKNKIKFEKYLKNIFT